MVCVDFFAVAGTVTNKQMGYLAFRFALLASHSLGQRIAIFAIRSNLHAYLFLGLL